MQSKPTREHIVQTGAELIARKGFGATGINAVLTTAGVPKGSFYHYFSSKDDFGLAIIDAHAAEYEAKLVEILRDPGRPPLERLWRYFEAGLASMNGCECAHGCLFGNLGQELAGQNERFRTRIDQAFARWEALFEACLSEAREQGQLAPDTDPAEVAGFLLSGWEGAILRAKVVKSTEPMHRFIRVFFRQCLRVEPPG